MNAAYEAPGSLSRIHLKEERYAVDVKLPGIDAGDTTAAAQRLTASGLKCSWVTQQCLQWSQKTSFCSSLHRLLSSGSEHRRKSVAYAGYSAMPGNSGLRAYLAITYPLWDQSALA